CPGPLPGVRPTAAAGFRLRPLPCTGRAGSGEDAGAAEDEVVAVDAAVRRIPSSFRSLLSLRGEDGPPPLSLSLAQESRLMRLPVSLAAALALGAAATAQSSL